MVVLFSFKFFLLVLYAERDVLCTYFSLSFIIWTRFYIIVFSSWKMLSPITSLVFPFFLLFVQILKYIVFKHLYLNLWAFFCCCSELMKTTIIFNNLCFYMQRFLFLFVGLFSLCFSFAHKLILCYEQEMSVGKDYLKHGFYYIIFVGIWKTFPFNFLQKYFFYKIHFLCSCVHVR